MLYLRYFSYLLRHKWFVFLACCRLGIPWLGIIHDLSKFRSDEWRPYAEFFYGKGSKPRRDLTGYYKPTDTGSAAFDFAWMLHLKRNRHHWAWWVLPSDDGGEKVLPMPERYMKEMLADWRGAGRVQGRTDSDLTWYNANKRKMRLHPETAKWLEEVLS